MRKEAKPYQSKVDFEALMFGFNILKFFSTVSCCNHLSANLGIFTSHLKPRQLFSWRGLFLNRELLTRCWGDDAVYVDRSVRIFGRDALADRISS